MAASSAMAETAKAKELKLELQVKKESLGQLRSRKKESPKKLFAEVDRGTYLISSRMAVAAEENIPKEVSNVDKENNSPLSNKSARKKKKMLKTLEGEATSLASVCVSTVSSGWNESSTSPLSRNFAKRGP